MNESQARNSVVVDTQASITLPPGKLFGAVSASVVQEDAGGPPAGSLIRTDDGQEFTVAIHQAIEQRQHQISAALNGEAEVVYERVEDVIYGDSEYPARFKSFLDADPARGSDAEEAEAVIKAMFRAGALRIRSVQAEDSTG
jgi:hypothetical protein